MLRRPTTIALFLLLLLDTDYSQSTLPDCMLYCCLLHLLPRSLDYLLRQVSLSLSKVTREIRLLTTAHHTLALASIIDILEQRNKTLLSLYTLGYLL